MSNKNSKWAFPKWEGLSQSKSIGIIELLTASSKSDFYYKSHNRQYKTSEESKGVVDPKSGLRVDTFPRCHRAIDRKRSPVSFPYYIVYRKSILF